MAKQVQVFFRMLFIGILVLGAHAQFAVTAQTQTITMTTAKAVGDKIRLTIRAEGNVSIDGATGTFINGRSVDYTLTKQTIIITGKVTSLQCIENQLTSLDVSKNTALTSLDCFVNQLTSLDVSKNTALTKLDCFSNQLTTLNMSQNTALTRLDCYKNQLTTLDMSKNAALTKLNCSSNQLGNLDISTNTALIELNCSSNQLGSLDVSKSIALRELNCDSNQLRSLDVLKNPALTFLGCATNQLTSLDVSKNPTLTFLGCYSNQLTSLDVSQNTALTLLYCFYNQIKGEAMTSLVKSLPAGKKSEICLIDTKNPKEQNICTKAEVAIAKTKGWRATDFNGSWISRKSYEGSEEEGPQENVITMTTAKKVGDKIRLTIKAEGNVSIDGAAGTFINDQRIEYTLTKQTITIEGKVTLLDCWLSEITNLDVSKSTALEKLYCQRNQLTKLDVSQHINLERLICYNNRLTKLDVSKAPLLTRLYCSENQLTKLNVSANVALNGLDCSFNKLTTLDVSANTALTGFDCSSNQLTKLDVSKNVALTRLRCDNNQIKDEAMTTLVNSLPTCDKNKEGDLIVINTKETKEGNVCTKTNVTIAKGKHWKVYDLNGSYRDRKEYEGSEGNSVAAINSGSVQIYPNPATDFVQIQGAKAEAVVRLYNLDGRLVLIAKTDADGIRLDVSTLAMGEYLLTVGSSYSQRISIVR